MLPLQVKRVRSLVQDLRSCMLYVSAKKKKDGVRAWADSGQESDSRQTWGGGGGVLDTWLLFFLIFKIIFVVVPLLSRV